MTPVSHTPTLSDEQDRAWRRVLWAMPSGLYLIGSRFDARINLMTANLVIQVATSPRSVGVAIERDAVTATLVRKGESFSVSLLHREQRALVRSFVKPIEEDRLVYDGAEPVSYKEIGLTRLLSGAPILSTAAAAIDCSLTQMVDLGSHYFAIGEVVGIKAPEGAVETVLRMEDTKMNYGG